VVFCEEYRGKMVYVKQRKGGPPWISSFVEKGMSWGAKLSTWKEKSGEIYYFMKKVNGGGTFGVALPFTKKWGILDGCSSWRNGFCFGCCHAIFGAFLFFIFWFVNIFYRWKDFSQNEICLKNTKFTVISFIMS